jgi:hypothetical protein
LSFVPIPQNLQEAISDPKCKEEMQDEMRALHKNNTWGASRVAYWKKGRWMQMSLYSEA